MTEHASAKEDWRDIVMSDPDMILEDRDLMRALIAANERQLGTNIVDMRGMAMERLETRLVRLEDTHRAVIAAAYENLAGTNQVHRAVLKMLEQDGFEGFMQVLGTDVAEILRVDRLRFVLESPEAAKGAKAPAALAHVLAVVHPGIVDSYITAGRDVPLRPVTLRQVAPGAQVVFGEDADHIRSEALLRVNLGPRRAVGMLALGSEDPHQFRANQGTDLLGFFAEVFERLMRRHLDS